MANTRLEPKKLSLPEMNAQKGESNISKLTYAARPRIAPPGANHGLFTANPIAAAMCIAPCGWPHPPPPVPPEPARQRAETTLFMRSVQYDVIKGVL